MRKNYVIKALGVFVLALMNLMSFDSVGQNYFTTGTLTSATTSTAPSIFGVFYTENRNQIIYRAADLQAIGMVAGDISSWGVSINNVPGMPAVNGFTVKIDTTSATNVSGNTFGPSPANTVYSGNWTIVANGWNQIPFSSNFYWDGVTNIIIETCWDNGTINYSSPNAAMHYTYKSWAANKGDYSDTQDGCTLSTPPTWSLGYQPVGRFEMPVPNDAAISGLLSPFFPSCAMDSLVSVELKNSGSNALTSATVNWSVNGTVQPAYSWTGNLTPGSVATVTLGTYAGGFVDGDSLVVYSAMPNGVADAVPASDTIAGNLYNSLNGSYTVDPSGTGDFVSFMDAWGAMETYGICGSVVLESVDTTYIEQFNFSTANIDGISDSTTITVTSISQDPTAVTLSYSATGWQTNWVVNINGANYVHLDNITIEALGTSYSRCLFSDGGDKNGFQLTNCNLTNGNTTSTSSYRALMYVYSGTSNDVIIDNNHFFQGSYAMYWGSPGDNGYFANNTIDECYYYGVYTTNRTNSKIMNNHVESSSSYSFGYGLYCYNLSGDGSEISGNYVGGNSAAWPRYGMYIYNAQGSLTKWLPVYNNRIFMKDGNQQVAMYVYNNLFVELAHNSIYKSLANAGGTNRGIWMYNGGYNKLYNNNIQVENQGTALYVQGSPLYKSDYNNLSADEAGNMGGTWYSSVADWSAATGFDSNSVKVWNVYSDTTTLKVCSDSLFGMGMHLPFYAMDYEGDARMNPPCIGADEFMPISMFGTQDDPVLCDGDTLVLKQDYYDMVVWNTTDTSNTLIVTSPGSQTVAVYDGCGSDTATFTVNAQQYASIGDTNLCEGTSAMLGTGISGGSYMWSNGSMDSTVMVDSATTISVMVTDMYGCSSADTAVVTQSYNVMLADSDYFCEGANIVLDANMTGTYLWSDGSTNQTLSVNAAGSYSVTVTDQNCVSSATSMVDEVKNVVPSFTDSSAYLTVIFTNTTMHADSYSWDFGDGTTSTVEHPTHIYPWTPVAVQTYNVVLTAYNVCGDDEFTNDAVRVGTMVSTSDIEVASMINVFPNPSNGLFNVNVDTESSMEMDVVVMDVRGAIVYNRSFGNVNGQVNQQVDIAGNATGIYFVKVTLGGESAVFRVVVE